MRKLAVLIGASLFLTGCGLVLQKPIVQAAVDDSLIGHAAPDFVGTDLDGKPIGLKDYRGHPLVMNFWASWCGPCRAEEPGFVRAAHDYSTSGVEFVGIDIRDSLQQARIYDDEFKVPFRSLFDQAARLGYAYHVDAPPATIFLDSKGIVAYKWIGELAEPYLRQIIDKYLLHLAAVK